VLPATSSGDRGPFDDPTSSGSAAPTSPAAPSGSVAPSSGPTSPPTPPTKIQLQLNDTIIGQPKA
jgi:hypothetical protein